MMLELRRIEPPQGLKERILSSTVRRSRMYRMAAIASVAAIIIGLGLGLLLGGSLTVQSQSQREAAKLLEAISQTSRPIEESSFMLLEAIVLMVETTSKIQYEEVVNDEGI